MFCCSVLIDSRWGVIICTLYIYNLEIILRMRGRIQPTLYLLGESVCWFLSNKDGNDQESIESSTTPVTGYHMGK